jgi:hypothetical protein
MSMITSRCKSSTTAAPDTTDQSDFVARHCTGMEVFTPSHSRLAIIGAIPIPPVAHNTRGNREHSLADIARGIWIKGREPPRR